jgi:hypothetical protein
MDKICILARCQKWQPMNAVNRLTRSPACVCTLARGPEIAAVRGNYSPWVAGLGLQGLGCRAARLCGAEQTIKHLQDFAM